MDQRAQALAYLEQDPLRHMNLLELLRRESAQLLYAEPDGLLLHDSGSGGYMLSAGTEEAAGRMLPLIPQGADLLVAHQEWLVPLLRRQLGLQGGFPCHQAAWIDSEPPEFSAFEGVIRPLDQSFTRRVSEIYNHEYAGEDYIREVISRGMLGAFVGGELAGFIGTHDEGTLGLLEVLPEYRRRGVAEALYRAMIRRVLARGGYAVGHIVWGNEASMALQRKVGMAISEHLLYWVFS